MKVRAWLAVCLAASLASCAGSGSTMAASPEEDAKAAVAAADEGNFQEAIRLLTHALETPGLPADKKAELTLHRAFAYDENGEFDQAIADYNKVIAMKPEAAPVYFRRGIAHREKGEYEQALADFDAAAKPGGPAGVDLTFIYGDRGVVRFAMGQFDVAARDFAHVVASDPSDEYAILWLYVSRGRAGAADQAKFAQDAAKAQGRDWPKPLVALYLGEQTPKQVLAAAAEGDEEARQFQGCEADFFVGEHDLLQGRVDAAKALLRKVVDECSPSLAVHTGAAGELKRIGE